MRSMIVLNIYNVHLNVRVVLHDSQNQEAVGRERLV